MTPKKLRIWKKKLQQLQADLKKTNDKINDLTNKRDAAKESGDGPKEQDYQKEIDKLVKEERKPKAKKIGEKKTELKALKAEPEQDDN